MPTDAPTTLEVGDGSSRDHDHTASSALDGLADYLRDRALLADDDARQRIGGQRNRLLAEAEDCRRWVAALAQESGE